MAPESERANTAETAAQNLYYDDCLVRGRVITLRGVNPYLESCDCEDHKNNPPSYLIEYRCAGVLFRLIKRLPKVSDFTFTGSTWIPTKKIQ